jgi:acyl-CoA reductase-like NAD-dependent aldehyde dehydrogenase
VVGEAIVTHPGVDMVSFTGSLAAGRRVAALAGDGIKKVTLELGGKSAFVVLDDAPTPCSSTSKRVRRKARSS